MEQAKRALSERERVGVRACGDEDVYAYDEDVYARDGDENDSRGRTVRWRSSAVTGDTIRTIQRTTIKDEDPSGWRTTRWLTRDDLATSCAALVDRARLRAEAPQRRNVDPMRLTTLSSSADRPGSSSSGRGSARRSTAETLPHGQPTAIAVGAARSYAC